MPLEEIATTLGVPATHVHRAGEQSVSSDLTEKTLGISRHEEKELSEHLRHLWKVVQPTQIISLDLTPRWMCSAAIGRTMVLPALP